MKFFSNIKNTKGFTLIELLIVVAIIGILSAVVLTSLGSARTKAKEAKVKSQMASMRAQAELFATNNNNKYIPSTGTTSMFATAASSGGLQELVTAVTNDGFVVTPGVTATGSAWAAYTTLGNGKTFCVDSNGFSGETVTALSGTVTNC